MSHLYVCKDGKLVPRDPQKTIEVKPLKISYNHLIRKIQQEACNCKEEIQLIKKNYQILMNQKNQQINALINRIVSKQSQIDKLQEEIKSLKKMVNNTPEKQQRKNSLKIQNFDSIFDRMDKTLNSTIVSNFSLCDFNSFEGILTCRSNSTTKTQKEMQECFDKTNKLMNQIEGIMKKKRKYEFHNAIQVQSSIIEQLENSCQRQEQQTRQIVMEDTFCIPNSQFNQDDNSLDITNYQSDHNFPNLLAADPKQRQFYQKLLNDSITLKYAIIQMKQQSSQQIRQIEEHYQKKLKIMYDELEKQKDKNRLIEVTKNKLNDLTDKGRKALVELELEENWQWDVGENNFHDGQILETQTKLKLKHNFNQKQNISIEKFT